ncbi:MAG TPA: quinone-dependent dihydroorotate dehydrogenase [Alphaproteobacteria bacterium]|nr:quinone-dependent dihydroorotate dehydrogenase [Alphaproteobacteria bacterium]
MSGWYDFIGPFLRLVAPETAHRLAIHALRAGIVPRPRLSDDSILHQQLWGLRFDNPVGLAAGFDKHAEVPDALLDQGFGFVEIGGVTPRPQPGNPRPRLFRLAEDAAIINRMGFNSEGLDVVRARLAARARRGIVGVNLGKNKEQTDAAADYAAGAIAFAPHADFLVINVSSPNTPGLRALQSRAALEEVVGRVHAALAALPVRPPLLLKVAPDLTEDDRRDIAEVALTSGLDGLIVSNTTLARPESLRSRHRHEAGGLSGRPLFGPSTALLAEFYRLTGGKLPLVGVGGIASGRDAYRKVRAGASLVQLYTALVFHGPGLVAAIRRDLAAALRADGLRSLGEAVGADHR